LFTLVATAGGPDVRAHAFEIVPAVADHLEANVERNGVRGRVEVHRVGVGAPGRTMRVPVGEGGSALPSFYSSRMTFTDGVDVPFVSLDDLLGDVPRSIRVLMKIDVEGTEDEVLANASAFVDRPHLDVLCEILAGVANERVLEDILSAAGLRRYLVRDDDLYAAASIRPNARFRDWLLTRRSPEDLRTPGVPVATA
jgi:FkbM family methyltransferase